MKSYLRTLVALGLLFFSLPALAMEDLTWDLTRGQTTRGHAAIPAPPPVPTDLFRSLPLKAFHYIPHIVNELGKMYSNGDPFCYTSDAFYRHALYFASTRVMGVKQDVLNLRCTSHDWKNLIDARLHLIPTLWQMSPNTEAPYPHLVTVITLNLNPLSSEEVQAQCRLLSGPQSSFKKLVSVEFQHFPVSYTGPKRILTPQDMESLSSLFASRAENIKYLRLQSILNQENAPILSKALGELKNLVSLQVVSTFLDEKMYKDFINSLSLPRLTNLCLQDGSDSRANEKCTIMISALKKFPKLNKVYLELGRMLSNLNPHFWGITALENKFTHTKQMITQNTIKDMEQAIREHPNKKLQWQVTRGF